MRAAEADGRRAQVPASGDHVRCPGNPDRQVPEIGESVALVTATGKAGATRPPSNRLPASESRRRTNTLRVAAGSDRTVSAPRGIEQFLRTGWQRAVAGNYPPYGRLVTDEPALQLLAPADPDTDLGEAAREWINSPAFVALLRVFDGPTPTGRLGEDLDRLSRWAASVWDFRRGAERHEASRRVFDQHIEDAVGRAGDDLQMLSDSRPTRPDYDHLLILGGMFQTSMRRAAYAGECARHLRLGTVVGLTTLRPASPAERDWCQANDIAPCDTEFDGVDIGVRRGFSVTGTAQRSEQDTGDPRTGWRLHTYPGAAPATAVLAAPSTEPATRRANTIDTYRFWADGPVMPPVRNALLLLATSSLHRVFQHVDGCRTLGRDYGCTVETIGVASRNIHGHRPTSTMVLQELLSLLRSLSKTVPVDH